MKNLIIMLLLIFLGILFLTIKINIKKLEIKDNKIKLITYIELYLFGTIKLFKKKIKKKDLIKLLRVSEEKRIKKKERKILTKINPKIEKLNIKINYGLRNYIYNAYVYALLQTILNIVLSKINAKENRLIIENQYNKKMYILIEAKIKISIIKVISQIIFSRNKIMSKKVIKNI